MKSISLTNFLHIVGSHCSSSSIASVLRYDGRPLSEAMVFGLGSGMGFYYLHDPAGSPTHRFNGRAADLEGNFYRHVGQPIHWFEGWQPEQAWQALTNARPVLAQGDIFYLPYYDPPVHFTGHGVVVSGIDLIAERVEVADIADPQPIILSFADFRAFMETENLPLLRPFRWGAAPNLEFRPVSRQTIHNALRTLTQTMLTPPSPIEGLPAMQQMADALPSWAKAPDWLWCARFGYQAIEKRGTGGGGFRYLMADFFQEGAAYFPWFAELQLPGRMRAIGDQWVALAKTVKAIFVNEDKRGFVPAGQQLQQIVTAETKLLQELTTHL